MYQYIISFLESIAYGSLWEDSLLKFLFDLRAMCVQKWVGGQQVLSKGLSVNLLAREDWFIGRLSLTDAEYHVYFKPGQVNEWKEVSRFLNSVDRLVNEQKELKAAALHDPLTGVLNRKGFEQWFDAQKRSPNHAVRFWLVLLDRDNCKNLKDTQGHAKGDEALIAIIQSLQQTLRNSDVIARLGGDEFVFVLDMTMCHPGVKKRLEDIRDRLPLDKYGIGVTMGVVCYPVQGTELGALLAKADERLYKGKAFGRNAIVLWEGDEEHG